VIASDVIAQLPAARLHGEAENERRITL
jgi:hypothetical protein